MSETDHLSDSREADLLACILANLPNDTDTQRNHADRIVCDLIDTGLCNPEAGPAVLEWWGHQEVAMMSSTSTGPSTPCT